MTRTTSRTSISPTDCASSLAERREVPIQLDHIYTGDCLEVLKTLPDESVHCCITLPAVLRAGVITGVDGQIGREATPKEYISRLTEVFTEVRRVLRSDGTLWLNISDTYAGKGKSGQLCGPQRIPRAETVRLWLSTTRLRAANPRI